MSRLSPKKISQLNEFGESEAWANYYQCASPEFVQKYRLEARKIGKVWVTMIPELDWPFYNRIVGLGMDGSATESVLDEALGLLENAGCQNFMAQISPLAQPGQLPDWLLARGFTKGKNWAKVYRGNQPAPIIPTDLRIESIGMEYAEAYAQVALAAFEIPEELGPFLYCNIGKPGWQHYLAFDGDLPVSAAAMFVRDEISWFGFGSTLASHRKRGGQGAMFARRIQDGLALGCKWFVTETSEDTPDNPNPSYHNMLRTGFELAYMRPNFVRKPAAS